MRLVLLDVELSCITFLRRHCLHCWLALAIKQDLVEDANIVAGDALRIIAAAKERAAQRDVYRAERSQHENKYGGEVHSEAPQMQETKAAAQENLGENPPSKAHRQVYHPEMVAFTMPAGKKHVDRMQQGEDDGPRTAVRYAGITTSGDLVISPQAYHCSLCNLTCSGKKNFIMHFKGRKHQALKDEVSDDEEDEEDLQSVPSKPAVPSTPIFPSRPNFPSQPAFPPQPTSLCTQDWRFQMKSTTRGLANLSMG